MGAWGSGNLENDAAMDWIGGFADAPAAGVVEVALREVLDAGEELDSDVAVEGLAAAEAVAAALGRPVADAGAEPYLKTAAATPGLSALAPLALQAVDVIARPDADANELYALWDEAGDAPAWIAAVAGVRGRLEP